MVPRRSWVWGRISYDVRHVPPPPSLSAVIAGLFRSRQVATPPPTPAAVPDGQRVYAIGDVHGCATLLDELVERIDADDAARRPADTRLILLGDLVDRGPDSAAVIAGVRALQDDPARRVTVLMGNHEEAFLSAVDEEPDALRFFLRVGGRETLTSFGLPHKDARTLDLEQLASWVRAHIPADVVAWLRSCPDQERLGDYLFVHAGVRPGVPLDEQRPSDLRWIRPEFVDDLADHGAMIVHGHTISADVDERHNRIGLDTGAYSSGVLSAMGFEGTERWTLQVRG